MFAEVADSSVIDFCIFN